MEIRTETEINAPAEVVWEILSNLANYPAWNSFTYLWSGSLGNASRADCASAPKS
jgi:uncharacterized protein YndB with AHSA1/START domain